MANSFKHMLLYVLLVYPLYTTAQEKNEHIQIYFDKNALEFNFSANDIFRPELNSQSENVLSNQTLMQANRIYSYTLTDQIKWDLNKNVSFSGYAFNNSLFAPKFFSNYRRNNQLFYLENSNQFNFYTISSDHNWGYEGATSLGFNIQFH